MTLFLTPSEIIQNKVASCQDNLTFLTAFLTSDFIDQLEKIVPANLTKTLLIRGRKEDFVNGSTNVSSVEKAMDLGWEVFVNENSHAKLYCFDWKEASIGSSNLTNKGFNLNGSGNIELNSLIELTSKDVALINSLINDSHKLTRNDLSVIKSVVENTAPGTEETFEPWSFITSKPVTILFPDDLLDKFSLPVSEYNAQVLTAGRYYPTDDEIEGLFLKSNEYKWLYNLLSNKNSRSATFGYVSQELHNSLVSNSRVYRKDIKTYLNHLEGWLKEFETDIKVSKSGHTTLFELKNEGERQ